MALDVWMADARGVLTNKPMVQVPEASFRAVRSAAVALGAALLAESFRSFYGSEADISLPPHEVARAAAELRCVMEWAPLPAEAREVARQLAELCECAADQGRGVRAYAD